MNAFFNLSNWIKKFLIVSLLLLIIITAACSPIPIPVNDEETTIKYENDTLVMGMLLVGGIDDNGWSEAHYNGALYAEQQISGTHFVFIDKVNPGDRPGVSPQELAEELVSQGAKIIIFNTDDMKADAVEFSKSHPDIHVIHVSGDSVWQEGKNYQPLTQFTNVMGRMEYGKMIAGCAAALTSESGKIAYLGPLENGETRRLASSTYLGARYCWQNYRNKPVASLNFSVEWIGYWFNIPGLTLDPTVVAESFYDDGFDVIISGIDTTEASQVAKTRFEQGESVWVIPFDYEGACEGVEEVCLGVPYFNWGPFYARYLEAYKNETPLDGFYYLEPDWNDINDQQTSAVGFINGPAMNSETTMVIREFTQKLSNGLILWAGPLSFSNGADFLSKGQIATDVEIWYLPDILSGMRNYTTN
ncbi:MAG: BMP family ABC transporter substrate-binding protein [Anaerolineaceae bacterium]|nr:BMP family ABC transporter substrate-binding protein [Anaerolineaceae bacterium]